MRAQQKAGQKDNEEGKEGLGLAWEKDISSASKNRLGVLIMHSKSCGSIMAGMYKGQEKEEQDRTDKNHAS